MIFHQNVPFLPQLECTAGMQLGACPWDSWRSAQAVCHLTSFMLHVKHGAVHCCRVPHSREYFKVRSEGPQDLMVIQIDAIAQCAPTLPVPSHVRLHLTCPFVSGAFPYLDYDVKSNSGMIMQYSFCPSLLPPSLPPSLTTSLTTSLSTYLSSSASGLYGNVLIYHFESCFYYLKKKNLTDYRRWCCRRRQIVHTFSASLSCLFLHSPW